MNTGELRGKHGFEVFQAPVWHPKVKKLPDPMNYAEILFRFGYLSQDRLFDMVMGWIYSRLLPLILLYLTIPRLLI